MTYCANCGKTIYENGNYCPFCGAEKKYAAGSSSSNYSGRPQYEETYSQPQRERPEPQANYDSQPYGDSYNATGAPHNRVTYSPPEAIPERNGTDGLALVLAIIAIVLKVFFGAYSGWATGLAVAALVIAAVGLKKHNSVGIVFAIIAVLICVLNMFRYVFPIIF